MTADLGTNRVGDRRDGRRAGSAADLDARADSQFTRPGDVAAQPAAAPTVAGHQNALDGVRAIAALMVLAFHVAVDAGTPAQPDSLAWLYFGGQAGVPIFFALSGLLLYRPYAFATLSGRPAPGARTYLRKRVLRILPVYWVLVVVIMLTTLRDHIGDWVTWIQLLTLTHVYDPTPLWNNMLGPNGMGQVWSLGVEWAWYLALPPTAALFGWFARRGGDDVGKRARRLLWCLVPYAALSPVFTTLLYVPHFRPEYSNWLPHFTAWFATGMAFAIVSAWAKLEPEGPAGRLCRGIAASWTHCWLIGVMMYVIASTPMTGAHTLAELPEAWTAHFHILVFGLCALFLVAPVALAPKGRPAMDALLSNRPMRFLGKISYGLFLWQMIIIYGWFQLTDRLHQGNIWIDLPVVGIATVVLSMITHYVIEEPVQKLSRRLNR